MQGSKEEGGSKVFWGEVSTDLEDIRDFLFRLRATSTKEKRVLSSIEELSAD